MRKRVNIYILCLLLTVFTFSTVLSSFAYADDSTTAVLQSEETVNDEISETSLEDQEETNPDEEPVAETEPIDEEALESELEDEFISLYSTSPGSTVSYTGTTNYVSEFTSYVNAAVSNYYTLTETVTYASGYQESQSYVAYCFNKDLGYPQNTNYPANTKYTNATTSQFVSLASNRYSYWWGGFGETEFRNAVLWCVYNGYPYNQVMTRDSKNYNFLQRAKDYGFTSDRAAMYALRKATQLAIWFFTDQDAILHGKIAWKDYTTPGTTLEGMTTEMSKVHYLGLSIAYWAYYQSGSSPSLNGKALELDLYATTETVSYAGSTSRAQNLLVARVAENSTPGTTEEVSIPEVPTTGTKKLSLQKNVSGTFADRDQLFDFTITLMDRVGNPLTGNYTVSGSVRTDSDASPPAQTVITLNDSGNASVSLTDGQILTISGLPDGYCYSITEAARENYKTSISSTVNANINNAVGTIASNRIYTDENSIVYTNTYEGIVLTGLSNENGLNLAILLSIAVGVTAYIVYRWIKRQKHA